MSEKTFDIPEDGLPLYARIAMDEGHSIRAWSREHVFLEPGKNKRRKLFRKKLQHVLGCLNARSDSSLVLDAVYSINGKPRSDIENLLFYNLNTGNFAASAQTGIRFKLVPWKVAPTNFPEAIHFYEYRLSPLHAPRPPVAPSAQSHQPTPFRMHASFENPSCLTNWMAVWYAIEHDERQPTHSVVVDRLEQFGIRATLRCPPGAAKINLAGMIKAVFDGIVASLHRQKVSQESEGDQKIVERILSRIPKGCAHGMTQATIRRYLFSDSTAPFLPGPLVKLHGKSVTCCSADHLCAAGALTIELGTAEKWELEAELYRTDRDT